MKRAAKKRPGLIGCGLGAIIRLPRRLPRSIPRRLLTHLLIVAALSLASCTTLEKKAPSSVAAVQGVPKQYEASYKDARLIPYLNAPLYKDGLINYPYVADDERKAAILTGYALLRSGMTTKELRSIVGMGAPDGIYPHNFTYKDEKKPTLIGFTYLYVLKRDIERGPGYLKQEISVLLRFNFEGRLYRTSTIGFQLEDPF